jgi:hypothetical protein
VLAARQKAAGRADRAARVRVGVPPGVEVSVENGGGRQQRTAAQPPARGAAAVSKGKR